MNQWFQQFHPSNWTPKLYWRVGIVLLAANVLGPNGLFHWVQLRQEVDRLTRLEKERQEQYADLKNRITQFRSSPLARERAIREELGYLKESEISVEFSQD